MTAAALLLVAIGIGLVRLGWGGRRGGAPAGWLGILASLAVLTARDGAWGLAIGTVVGIAAALACLGWAGWSAPVRHTRAPREAPAVLLPRRWQGVARRLAVFALVVPVGFAAAQWLTFGVQAFARAAGAGAADTTALSLMGQPMIWAALMSWQMTRADAWRMIPPPAIAACAGTLLWSLS